jgi:hypothetical protein
MTFPLWNPGRNCGKEKSGRISTGRKPKDEMRESSRQGNNIKFRTSCIIWEIQKYGEEQPAVGIKTSGRSFTVKFQHKTKEIMESGAMGFVQKPYNVYSLLSKVSGVMDVKG